MITDPERISRANKAKAELEVTNKAFDEIRQAVLEEIVRTSPDQSAKREALYNSARVVDMVRAILNATVADGAMANHRQIMAEHGLLRP